jgi:hypothetical protein
MNKNLLTINRAPVITLWASIVAERMGYDHKTALTLGKAVASLNAQSKGKRLGIFEKVGKKPLRDERKAGKATEEVRVALLGRLIPTVRTREGVRAAIHGEAIDPQVVIRYLNQRFGERLGDAQEAMRQLAKGYKKEELATDAYVLYEKFRPTIPEGKKGWGAKGELDLSLIHSLAK